MMRKRIEQFSNNDIDHEDIYKRCPGQDLFSNGLGYEQEHVGRTDAHCLGTVVQTFPVTPAFAF